MIERIRLEWEILCHTVSCFLCVSLAQQWQHERAARQLRKLR